MAKNCERLQNFYAAEDTYYSVFTLQIQNLQDNDAIPLKKNKKISVYCSIWNWL